MVAVVEQDRRGMPRQAITLITLREVLDITSRYHTA